MTLEAGRKHTINNLSLDSPIDFLQGVGPKLAESYAKQGINSVRDLFFNFPRKYRDYSKITEIHQLRPGQVTIKVKISSLKTRYARRGLTITEGLASDDSGSVLIVWFNQPYRQKSFIAGELYYLSGEFKLSNKRFSLINPTSELVSGDPLSSARIVPVYRESAQLNSLQIRKALHQVIKLTKDIDEWLPKDILNSSGLIDLAEALRQIHFPDNMSKLEIARQRLSFDDLFPMMLANKLSELERIKIKALIVEFKLPLAKKFVSLLPFKLTDDQRRVIWQIYKDLECSEPMNRLVEGDVGSGKTVVAVMAAVMALNAGYQVAFMAPTELLARQHEITIKKLLEGLKMSDALLLLTGSMNAKEKKEIIKRASEPGRFIIGTHSLLTSGINWEHLALLIIDEQHRFGVDQRMMIQKNSGRLPHFLSITATPIPRSLALTVFSDLKLSRLVSMPANRKEIKTELIGPTDADKLTDRLKQELAGGRQVYVVCPYIKSEGDKAIYSLEKLFPVYEQKLKGYRVGIMHGQMSAEEQTAVMEQFVSGMVKVLIATTIIEVGVDVANASVMVIHGPDRFGLAQLHQLRGRVGRGAYESYCFLMLNDSLEPPMRLREFASIIDGFRLSELDLKIRGPGAIYGTLQHGKLPVLISLDDHQLIEIVKRSVDKFITSHEELVNYSELAKRVAAAQQLTYLN